MSGLTPRKYKDHRRYSFHRTFGSTLELVDCDFDTGLTNFNQNEPNPVTGDPALINGCTALTRTDIATNEDHIIYKPGFTYEKTCLIDNVPVGSPCTLESSFKSGIVYGLQAVGETTDEQALAHRRGAYYEVEKSEVDWFNSFWSALLTGKKGLSVGTPWFPELTDETRVDIIVTRITNDWHNWEVLGVTTTDRPRMKVKAHTGDIKWFGREVINDLMGVKGADCLTDVNGKATPADAQTVRVNLLELLISLYKQLIQMYQKGTFGALNYYEFPNT